MLAKNLWLVSFVWRVRVVSHSCREIEQRKYLYYLLLLLKISKYFQYFQFQLPGYNTNIKKHIFLKLRYICNIRNNCVLQAGSDGMNSCNFGKYCKHIKANVQTYNSTLAQGANILLPKIKDMPFQTICGPIIKAWLVLCLASQTKGKIGVSVPLSISLLLLLETMDQIWLVRNLGFYVLFAIHLYISLLFAIYFLLFSIIPP